MSAERRRFGLWLGLFASFALHVVFALVLMRTAPRPAPPGPGGADDAVDVQILRTTSEPAAPARGARRSAAAPVAERLVPSGERVIPSEVEGPSASSAPGSGEEAGGSGGAGDGGPSTSLGTNGGSSAAGASRAAELSARLQAAALRCYPQAAARFHLTGEASLAFCLSDDGRATSSSVSRSSGTPALDRAAQDCVLPGALPFAGAAGCYQLPIRFGR